MDVPESNIVFVRCCVRGQLIQQLHHAFSLLGSPHLDGGATSNPAILLLNFGGSAFGDEWCQLVLNGKCHEVSVQEESLKEVLNFSKGFGAPHV